MFYAKAVNINAAPLTQEERRALYQEFKAKLKSAIRVREHHGPGQVIPIGAIRNQSQVVAFPNR